MNVFQFSKGFFKLGLTAFESLAENLNRCSRRKIKQSLLSAIAERILLRNALTTSSLSYKKKFTLQCHHPENFFCQRIHLAPFLGWINVNAKPKTELNISVFMQKRMNKILGSVSTLPLRHMMLSKPSSNEA